MEFFILETVQIDLEKGLVLINGEDVGSATRLSILFENGTWKVEATKDLI